MEKWLALFDACNGVSTDSRQIIEGCLYIALKGENFDGNLFAEKAIAEGARYAIVDNPEFANVDNIFFVPDGLLFLQQLAHAHRKRFHIPILGITGSNGKTSTKELVNAVLQTKYNVLCTQGNLNNHIGVPLTLLQLHAQHELAIIEMGANKPLDIDELCRIAAPTLGLITNIGKAHLEGFINFEGVLQTKSELYDHVAALEGGIFVNAQDPILLAAAQKRRAQIFTYGEQNGELRGQLAYLDPYVHFSWTYQAYVSPVIDTQMVGKYNFYNFLAALRVGLYFEIEPKLLNNAIANYKPTNKRSQVEKTTHNTVIVDCYNANPSSMQSALSSFVEMEHPDKLAILGDMLELGADGPAEHQKILDFVRENKLKLLTVGPIFQDINANGYGTVEELNELLAKDRIKDKLILLKGSRGIALEKLMDCF
jgi:UDP-N-acetylmuramoyl-tripeptide--D-alanyl-D-alanine ligase